MPSGTRVQNIKNADLIVDFAGSHRYVGVSKSEFVWMTSRRGMSNG